MNICRLAAYGENGPRGEGVENSGARPRAMGGGLRDRAHEMAAALRTFDPTCYCNLKPPPSRYTCKIHAMT